jgi:hypothetical protein
LHNRRVVRHRSSFWPFALACLLAVSCGDANPTTPTPPASGTLSIAPQADLLTIGASAALQAMLTSPSGTSQAVAASWSTDDGRVAGVDRQGRVTALGSGSTSVRAAFEGLTAALAIRVVPDFAGTWSGSARVAACSSPVPAICQRDYAVGTAYVTRVTLVQSRDAVTATLYAPYPAALPTVPAPVVDATLSGRIELGGALPMTGVLVGSTPSSPPVGTIGDWRTAIDTTQPIQRGAYTEVTPGSGGITSITWELVGLTRTS